MKKQVRVVGVVGVFEMSLAAKSGVMVEAELKIERVRLILVVVWAEDWAWALKRLLGLAYYQPLMVK